MGKHVSISPEEAADRLATGSLSRTTRIVQIVAIPADDLARAMVDVAVQETRETGGKVFENRDIRALVKFR